MQLKDNTILIIPSNIKEYIIEKIRKENSLLDIKFLTKEEFIKKMNFSYDNKTIYYLMKKYNLKYEIAKIYIDNMYYVSNKKYKKNKLNYLVELKEELQKNNLITTNEKIQEYYNTKNIVVYGFDYIDNYFHQLLSKLKNLEIINKEYNNYDIKEIYEFQNIEEETEYVANKICNLILKGYDINNIKLVIDNSYQMVVEKIFSYYNIPISINKTSIYNTHLGNKFLNNLNNIEETLKYILVKDSNIYNKIVEILNNYTWCNDYNEVKEMLIHDLKNTYINKPLEKSIEVISLKNIFIKEEDYVFVLGFNQGIIPKIYKDEEYITDSTIEELGIETTLEKNKIEKEITLKNLKKIKNLFISYKLSDFKVEYYISSLNDKINANIIKKELKISAHSNISNKIKLTAQLDNLINYGTKDNNLELLYSNYDIDYQKFNNKYTKINKENLNNYIDNKILLSYSSLDSYNKCNFKYYLENILKISIYEDTFMTSIGTIFHEVLSKMNDNFFNLDASYNKAITKLNKNFTVKEKFFLDKLKKELEFIISTIKEYTKYTKLDNYLYEEKIYTNIEGNIKITFMGIIDKIMYKKYNNKTYLAIVDYKTGNPNINLNNVIYGIDMQLPIYLYLVKNTNKLTNVEIAGFYLQKILNENPKKDYQTDYIKLKKDALKLQGYSNMDKEILEKLDSKYYESDMIKSLKESKEGFYKYSKVISTSNIDKLTNIVENKIKENATSILNASFDINPKRQENELLGCKFCKFNDICFRKEEDIIDIKKYKDLEFLNQ